MRWLKRLIAILGIVMIVYLMGPMPETAQYNLQAAKVPSLPLLENYIRQQESKHQLRPDNEARIVWANDSIREKTAFSIVYLHGFSASQEEGDPVHRNIAKAFGCNLYLSRLSQHGIDTTEQLLNLTPENYWESAKEALAIGKELGEKVILMGTSTGATQAIQLAASYPSEVAALILYSPNIAINDNNAWLLNNPWGLQIARLVKGGNYHDPEDSRPIYRQYWNKPYRLEAIVALEEMLETTMIKSTFSRISQPVLLLYYYKDEANQDKVVKVTAMKKMFEQLATAPHLKRALALPNTGNHVIASPIKSADIQSVEKETSLFLQQVLKLPLKQSLPIEN